MQLWIPSQRGLHQDVDLLLGEPRGPNRLETRPGPITDPLHLVALHRERDLDRARIAGDDSEFGAKHSIQKTRRGLGIDTSGATDDQLRVKQILRGAMRRSVPRQHDADLAADAADPVKLVQIEAHLRWV